MGVAHLIRLGAEECKRVAVCFISMLRKTIISKAQKPYHMRLSFLVRLPGGCEPTCSFVANPLDVVKIRKNIGEGFFMNPLDHPKRLCYCLK